MALGEGQAVGVDACAHGSSRAQAPASAERGRLTSKAFVTPSATNKGHTSGPGAQRPSMNSNLATKKLSDFGQEVNVSGPVPSFVKWG